MKLRNKEFDEIFEVITFGYANSEAPNGNGDYPVEFISLEAMDEDGDNYEYRYRSLKDLNAVWEDYKPAEPLIKDEEIRKAVRAWAEAEDVTICRVDKSGSCLMNLPAIIQFWGYPFVELNNREYTIDELCGEDEEK